MGIGIGMCRNGYLSMGWFLVAYSSVLLIWE